MGERSRVQEKTLRDITLAGFALAISSDIGNTTLILPLRLSKIGRAVSA